MSKNPHKKAGNQKGNQTVLDQQNEPIFKAINKKIRNINKKLNEISQLQAKESLKPEQLDKINKKDKTVQERSKYEEFMSIYRQFVTENLQAVRQYQKRDLANLAQALTLHNAGNGPSNPQVAAIYKAITGKSNGNHDQRADSLTNLFNQFADDKNIEKWIQDGKAGKLQQKAQQKPKEKKTEEKKETQEKPEVKEETKKQQPVELSAIKISSLPPVVEQKPVVCQTVKEQTKIQTKPAQQSKPADQQNKEERKQRPRKQRDPNKPRRNYQDGKRKYKPKNDEKNEQNREQGDNDNESEQQAPVERNKFTHKEVQQLHDEGFIVIGKPKTKPQSRQDRDQFYGKTHGRKQFHHHGSKRDY